MATTPGRRRRHYKGARDAMMIRPDLEVGHAVRARATEAGMTISDYVWALMARDVQMPERAPSARPRSDEPLPLDDRGLLTG